MHTIFENLEQSKTNLLNLFVNIFELMSSVIDNYDEYKQEGTVAIPVLYSKKYDKDFVVKDFTFLFENNNKQNKE